VAVPTRFRDLDPMGHVNSGVYFAYMEMARTTYFAESGVSDLRVPGVFGIPVVSQTCNYRRQVFHPATVEVGVRCVERKEKTVALDYGLFLADGGPPVADGRSVSAWVDLRVPKAIPLPAELIAAIAAYEAG